MLLLPVDNKPEVRVSELFTLILLLKTTPKELLIVKLLKVVAPVIVDCAPPLNTTVLVALVKFAVA